MAGGDTGRSGTVTSEEFDSSCFLPNSIVTSESVCPIAQVMKVKLISGALHPGTHR